MDLNKKIMIGICGAVTAAVISGCGTSAGAPSPQPADDTIAMNDDSYLNAALAAADEPANPRDSAAPGETAAQGDRPGRHRHPWRARRFFRGLHGEATIRTKSGFAQVVWQRGQVTAVSGSGLTVRSADGASWQWVVNGDTKIRKKGDRSSLKQLAANDWILVIGELSGSTRTARAAVVPRRVPKNAPVPTPTAS
jgi:hypothetical protein